MIFIRSPVSLPCNRRSSKKTPGDWFVPSNFPPANARRSLGKNYVHCAALFVSFDSSATDDPPSLFTVCTLPINGRWRPTGFTRRKITTPSVIINTESYGRGGKEWKEKRKGERGKERDGKQKRRGRSWWYNLVIQSLKHSKEPALRNYVPDELTLWLLLASIGVQIKFRLFRPF